MPNQRPNGDLLHYGVMGLEFALTFCLFTVGGLALDKALDTLPGYTIFCGLCGAGLGLYRLIRKGLELWRKQRQQDQAGNHERDQDDGFGAGDAA